MVNMYRVFRSILHCICNLAEFYSSAVIAPLNKAPFIFCDASPKDEVRDWKSFRCESAEKSYTSDTKKLRTPAGHGELANWVHGHSILVLDS